MTRLEFISVYCFGAFGYGALETLWRGRTHWTMLVTGGLCFLCIYIISSMSLSLFKKCLLGASVITTIEFLVGVVVNIQLGWHVWDYSWLKGNLMGQICLLYFLIWFFLCIPCMYFAKFIKAKIFTRRYHAK